jgi:hypothetical protein
MLACVCGVRLASLAGWQSLLHFDYEKKIFHWLELALFNGSIGSSF